MPAIKKPRSQQRSAHKPSSHNSALKSYLSSRWIKVIILASLTIICVISTSWFIVRGGLAPLTTMLNVMANAGMHRAGLQINAIMVEGRHYTTVTTLQKAIGHQRGQLIAEASPYDIQQRVEKLPWVRSAIVQRRWPSTLYIRLTEQYPIALWQKGNQYHLVDDQGHVISGHDIKDFNTLPILTGDGAPIAAPALIDVLQHFPQVRKRMTGAVLVSKRRWDIIINGKVTVKLPEGDIQDELAQLTELLQGARFNDDDIITIDLRTSNHIYFHLSDDAIKRKKTVVDKKI